MVISKLDQVDVRPIRNVLAGALVSLNLATFAASQEDNRVEPQQSAGTVVIDTPPIQVATKLEEDLTLPSRDLFLPQEQSEESLNEGLGEKHDAPSAFQVFKREAFQQEVWRTQSTLKSGATEFHYKFFPLPVENAPSLIFCGVPIVAGWVHHDQDIKEIERHLANSGFTVVDKPLEEVLPSLATMKGVSNEQTETETETETKANSVYQVSLKTKLLLGFAATMVLLTAAKLALVRAYNIFNKKDQDEQDTSTLNKEESQIDVIPPEHEYLLPHSITVLQNSPIPIEEVMGRYPQRSIDYQIKGTSQPVLALRLKPGESIIAESGAMLHHDSNVVMNVVTGKSLGFSSASTGVIKRLLVGESFFFQKFSNQASNYKELTLAPSKVGELLHLNLCEFSDGLCADQGAFFAATSGVELSIIKRGGVKGLFSGLGFFQQRLQGNGDVFLFSAGAVERINVNEGDELILDSDALFAWEPSIAVELERQKIFDTFASGEGLYICRISGSGSLWIASRGSNDDASRNSSGGLLGQLGKALNIT